MSADQSLADLQGPAGNTYDKYGTRNPLARRVVSRFLRDAERAVEETGAKTILDVGCGEGVLTERLARMLPDAQVTGLDIGGAGLESEWDARAGGNCAFQAGSVYSLPFDSGSFELVCAFETLEHLERPEDGLAELKRVASRHLVLSVPREPIWRALNVLSFRYLRALGDTPGHVNHWSRRTFVDFARSAGEVTRIRTPLPWTIVTVRR